MNLKIGLASLTLAIASIASVPAFADGFDHGREPAPTHFAEHDNGTRASYLSAGLGVATMSWGLDVAGRRQVKGGDETLIIASMRVFGPRLPAPPVE